jgi:hypothetical protein
MQLPKSLAQNARWKQGRVSADNHTAWMKTKESAKGIRQALAQALPFLANDAEFAKVGRRARLHAENGFSVAAPDCNGISRQEQITLDASFESGNLAERI